jgi:hypothetical protein
LRYGWGGCAAVMPYSPLITIIPASKPFDDAFIFIVPGFPFSAQTMANTIPNFFEANN